MKKRSHARAPGMINFSVSMPEKLRDELSRIAQNETRNRNQQIQHFLEIAVREYQKKSAASQPQTQGLKTHGPPAKSTHFTRASGA